MTNRDTADRSNGWSIPGNSIASARVRNTWVGAWVSWMVASLPFPAMAFDASQVPDGLYYNGTTHPFQLWTPLLFAENGLLIDPFIRANEAGLDALTGKGKTTHLAVNTTFLYRACSTAVQLRMAPPGVLKTRTVYVESFDVSECQPINQSVFNSWTSERPGRVENPIPTYLQADLPVGMAPVWYLGMPGYLAGKGKVITPESMSLKASPNGVLSRSHFLPLPIVEVDYKRIAIEAGKLPPVYKTSMAEIAHRSSMSVDSKQLTEIKRILNARLQHAYLPILRRIAEESRKEIDHDYLELGLIQAIDIDNSRSMDYAGVARFGARENNGNTFWIDVVWTWRAGLGEAPDALHVLTDSGVALNAAWQHAHHRSEKYFRSPVLVISAFADFDKDKKMEVVTSLLAPQENSDDPSAPEREVWLRTNDIYAWESGSTKLGGWRRVFRTEMHEARLF